MNALTGLLYVAIALFIYMIPTVVAHGKRSDAMSIGVLNFLLGWTFIGWVVALVWALKPEKRS